MDISRPNNFPRVEELARRAHTPIVRFFDAVAVLDSETRDAIVRLHEQGYLADPHSALAWQALDGFLEEGET
ncbi:MAG: threonine synthase, partial [Gammaproteobacteria bacterium]|nr:threonine synthase [Gammaproteobacteria bacterium]